MAVNYSYNYAIIDPDSYLCVEVCSITHAYNDPTYIEIPTYNTNYIFKYYNPANGCWYYDSEYTQIWDPDASL